MCGCVPLIINRLLCVFDTQTRCQATLGPLCRIWDRVPPPLCGTSPMVYTIKHTSSAFCFVNSTQLNKQRARQYTTKIVILKDFTVSLYVVSYCSSSNPQGAVQIWSHTWGGGYEDWLKKVWGSLYKKLWKVWELGWGENHKKQSEILFIAVHNFFNSKLVITTAHCKAIFGLSCSSDCLIFPM